MKSILPSSITISDANSHLLILIPKVTARIYKFSWTVIFNGLLGNGNNGQLSIGFGDNFVGSTGGPDTEVLNNGASQFACLSPDGSALNGISNPLYTGIPPLVTQANVTPPLYTQIAIQTGFIELLNEADIALYFAPSAFDGTDKQLITDAILILEPV